MSFVNCIRAVTAAAGRALTDDEVLDIYTRVQKAAREIRKGEAGEVKDLRVSESPEQSAVIQTLIEKAAQRASAEKVAEAKLRQQRTQLQIVKTAEREADVKVLRASGLDSIEAVEKTLVRSYGPDVNVESAEQRYSGTLPYYARKLQSTWDSLGNDWWGFFQDRSKEIELARALRGETADALAAKGAKAFHDVAEEMRQHKNSLGAEIGKLDDPYMPQHHAQEYVSRAAERLSGQETADVAANREAWVEFVLPLVEGNWRYTDDLGNPWSQDDLREFLGHAWANIATDGIASQKPGQFVGAGMRANRGREHRQIHFNSAEGVLKYWSVFGNKPLVQILIDHIESGAKDIAFLDHYGPNPDLTFRQLLDQALIDSATGDAQKTDQFKAKAASVMEHYRYAAGKSTMTFSPRFGRMADTVARLHSAAMLGSAAVASFYGDKPIYEAVSHMNDIPAVQRWVDEVRLLNPLNTAERAALRREGLMTESLRSGLNRFAEQLGDSSFSGKLANAVLRVTGHQAINDIRKGIFGANLFDAIGGEIASGKEFKSLETSDMRLLRHFGITETDWAVWRLAQLEDWGHGHKTMLTPSAIDAIETKSLVSAGLLPKDSPESAADSLRRNAVIKLLGAVNTESEFAVVTPGWKERSAFYSGAASRRGTLVGELTRSFLQFKMFPYTQVLRGLDAIANQPTPVSKAVMTAYLVGATTLAGAMTLQTREMLAGRDPRSMTDENWLRFIGAAFLQGGAIGIYGDFLYSLGESRFGQGPLEIMAGPTIGPVLGLATGGISAVSAYQKGRETNYPSKIVQFVKGYVPGSNIWYARAAFDHLIWQQVMEQVNPGYLARFESRIAQDYNQQWWWRPGELAPERPPEFSAAFSQ